MDSIMLIVIMIAVFYFMIIRPENKRKKRAEEMLAKGGLTDKEYKIAQAKLQRALVRLNVK